MGTPCFVEPAGDKFYDFACYAKAKLNVEQLLYLDGTISHMYMKARQSRGNAILLSP